MDVVVSVPSSKKKRKKRGTARISRNSARGGNKKRGRQGSSVSSTHNQGGPAAPAAMPNHEPDGVGGDQGWVDIPVNQGAVDLLVGQDGAGDTQGGQDDGHGMGQIPIPPARRRRSKLSISSVRREKRSRNRANYNARVISKVRGQVKELKVREEGYKEDALADHELNLKMQGEMVALSQRAGQLTDILKVRTQRFMESTEKTKKQHSTYKKNARESLNVAKEEGRKSVAFAEKEGKKIVQGVIKAGQVQLDKVKTDAQLAIDKEKQKVVEEKEKAVEVKARLYEVRKTIEVVKVRGEKRLKRTSDDCTKRIVS